MKKALKISIASFMLSVITLGYSLSIIHAINNRNVAEAWSGKQTPNIGNYYDSISDSLTGNALKSALKTLDDKKSKSKSYDWSRYEAEDEIENDTTSIICIYTRHAIKKNSHCGSYAWDRWNREHVWTQSAYPASDTDNHNIFACEGQINNYRGNLPYAEVEHNNTTRQVVFGHQTDCYIQNGKFEPCDEAKGEIARAVMYGVVMYNYTMTNMISYETVLKWNLEHPVTNRDIFRNNKVQTLQNNRNPFVDHPEYACKIWGDKSAETKAICKNIKPATLTNIETKDQKTEFKIGEEFVYNGTCTAYYSDSDPKIVTPTVDSSEFNMNQEGEYTIKLSYTEGSTTVQTSYKVKVSLHGPGVTLPVWAIVLIAVGGVLVVGGIALAIILIIKKKH